MNILMISTDVNILVSGSEANNRMKDYGTIFDELHILLLGSRLKDKIFSNVFIYPMSRRKALFWHPKFLVNIVTAQDPFENGFIAYLLAKKIQIPLQLQIHTDFLSPYFARESLINKIRIKIAEFLLPRAEKIRVVSERIKKTLIHDSRFIIHESKITVLPIFVDVEKIKNAPVVTNLHKKYPDHDFIILMASRLTREKNIQMAVEAMESIVERFPKTLLLIVGDGPEKSKIKSQISNLGLEKNIVIEAWTDDLTSYYKTADLFLLTSNYEGYGRTVVEAMAAGCPIAMTDVGLAGEFLKDNVSGLIVPVNSSRTLGEVIQRLVNNPALRSELKNNSLDALGSFYGKDVYLKMYKQSLS